MRYILLVLLVSCQSTKHLTPHDTNVIRTSIYQKKIDDLIKQDAENKKWARIYLQEIDSAMLNDDMVAYAFFVGEFEKIPLDIVPHHLRTESGYIEGPSDLELHFRLRWFEQAILLYKRQSGIE